MRHRCYILISVLLCCIAGNEILYAYEWSFLGIADTRGGAGLSVPLQWSSSSLTNPAPSFLIHAGDLEPLSAVDNIVSTYFNKPFFQPWATTIRILIDNTFMIFIIRQKNFLTWSIRPWLRQRERKHSAMLLFLRTHFYYIWSIFSCALSKLWQGDWRTTEMAWKSTGG